MEKQYNSKSGGNLGFWPIAAVFIIVGLIILGGIAYDKSVVSSESSKTSRQIALVCTTDMATKFHIHPHLKIIILGKEREIPEDIGIKPMCMNAIHTHDDTGVIHIESPIKKDFTIGDFFAVWQKPFTKSEVIDTKISADEKMVVSVNGKEVDSFDETIMNDGDQIVIEVK